jgi:AcrR family transcriptional regulator
MRTVTGEVRVSTRSDARDNRHRVVQAARETFAADGLDAPLRKIARRAGVGIATLYRHFPSKDQLIEEALVDDFVRCEEVVRDGLAASDAATGLTEVIERLMVMHATNRGLARALSRRTKPTGGPIQDRTEVLRLLGELVANARNSGSMRPDLRVADIVLALQANDGIRAATPALREAASRRFAELIVAGFRTV